MGDFIANIIKDNLGLSFLIGLIVIGALIFFIWWARGIYDRIKKIDHLPCGDHKDKLDLQISKHSGIETSIARIETSITFMQKNIESLTQNLQRGKGIITDSFTQTHSPLSITDDGYTMIERLGLNEMFENNWLRIKLLIEENNSPRNPYDIQQFFIEQAIVFPEKFLKEEELAKIKLDAYNLGISLTSYMKAIAVMARDRYFEENNINVTDVDIYDPNISN